MLLGGDGKILGDSVAYRDQRTEGMDREVSRVISPRELYSRTGIQKQIFNTIYQLEAVKKENPEQLSRARRFLMIPDYLNFLLTGVMQNEYTVATSTGLVNARTKTWDGEILRRLGFPKSIFGPLAVPGTRLGGLREKVRKEAGFDCEVLLPATHDTASAFLSVPARDDRSVYISSGTWSLLGVENREPITTEESRLLNFTNEGGYRYRFRYLKNIMGLWMIQSIRRELNAEGKKVSFDELENAARSSGGGKGLIDVNDASFLSPASMIQAVNEFLRKAGQPVPASVGELVQCVYKSLADSYRKSIRELSRMTGKKYTSVNIVGGGAKDRYLNELTAQATGLPVFSGPVEGTALGNLIVQMIAAGEFPDLSAARAAVRNSFPGKEYVV